MKKIKLISCPECQKESPYNSTECKYCDYPFEKHENVNVDFLPKKITPTISFVIIVVFLAIAALISLVAFK